MASLVDSIPGPAEPSIATVTRSSIDAFQKCIQQLEGGDKTHLQIRLADLRLWADSVGATAQWKTSLDSRFQHRPKERHMVRELLTMLKGVLDECYLAARNNSDMKRTIINLDAIVDTLAFIGVRIRLGGRQYRLRKADKSFERKKGDYLDLRAHLACVIVSRPTKDGRPDEEGDKIHSLEYFETLKLSPMQERLVQANLRRRHRFMEAQSQSHALSEDRPKKGFHIVATVDVETKPEKFETKSKIGQAPGQVSAAVHEQSSDGPSQDASARSASDLDSKWRGLESSPDPRAGSTASNLTAFTAAARYPKWDLPSTDLGPGEKLVKCPCCCQAVPVAELEGSQQKKHVANDLFPYSCMVENCPTPYNLFLKREELNSHIWKDHPPKWQCPYCEERPQAFEFLSGIRHHLVSDHKDDIPEDPDDLEDLLLDTRVNEMGITECPLCGYNGPEDSPLLPDSPDLIEHVMLHVHDLSLRSIPWPMDPVISLEKHVGSADMRHAVKYIRDKDGEEHIVKIAEWDDTVDPILDPRRGVIVKDDKGEDLVLQNAILTDVVSLKLCDFDRNPPKASAKELQLMAQFKKDYFSQPQNGYFNDVSSDGRISESSQASNSSHKSQIISKPGRNEKPRKWICTLCRLIGFRGDDEYFQHLENDHLKEMEEESDKAKVSLEVWKRSKLDEAYWEGVEEIPAPTPPFGSPHFDPRSPANEVSELDVATEDDNIEKDRFLGIPDISCQSRNSLGLCRGRRVNEAKYCSLHKCLDNNCKEEAQVPGGYCQAYHAKKSGGHFIRREHKKLDLLLEETMKDKVQEGLLRMIQADDNRTFQIPTSSPTISLWDLLKPGGRSHKTRNPKNFDAFLPRVRDSLCLNLALSLLQLCNDEWRCVRWCSGQETSIFFLEDPGSHTVLDKTRPYLSWRLQTDRNMEEDDPDLPCDPQLLDFAQLLVEIHIWERLPFEIESRRSESKRAFHSALLRFTDANFRSYDHVFVEAVKACLSGAGKRIREHSGPTVFQDYIYEEIVVNLERYIGRTPEPLEIFPAMPSALYSTDSDRAEVKSNSMSLYDSLDFHEPQDKNSQADDFFSLMTRFTEEHIKVLKFQNQTSEKKLLINRKIRIAVLDSGIWIEDPYIAGARRAKIIQNKNCRNFSSSDPKDWHDNVGHGTRVTRLLFQVAPEAELFIAKVSDELTIPKNKLYHIANAINWAVQQWEVDIIMMPIALSEANQEIDAVLDQALGPDYDGATAKIIFAAAGNEGANGPLAWPARKNGVIAIHATDGQGTAAHLNPSNDEGQANFATLGRDIKMAWLSDAASGTWTDIYISGTSFATPIAAGIAANVLEFARHRLDLNQRRKDRLFSYGGMRKIFKAMSTRRGGYYYVQPWTLLGTALKEDWGNSKDVKLSPNDPDNICKVLESIISTS